MSANIIRGDIKKVLSMYPNLEECGYGFGYGHGDGFGDGGGFGDGFGYGDGAGDGAGDGFGYGAGGEFGCKTKKNWKHISIKEIK